MYNVHILNFVIVYSTVKCFLVKPFNNLKPPDYNYLINIHFTIYFTCTYEFFFVQVYISKIHLKISI